MQLICWPRPILQAEPWVFIRSFHIPQTFTCMYAENVVLSVQTVVLFNGEEIKEWSFSSGVFRTT